MVVAKHHPANWLGQFPIDEDRPMKVVVIGAGYSGIAAGIRYVCTFVTFQVFSAQIVNLLGSSREPRTLTSRFTRKMRALEERGTLIDTRFGNMSFLQLVWLLSRCLYI